MHAIERGSRIRFLAVALGVWAGLAAAAADDLPAHPSDLEFPPLDFEPPLATDFRHELSGGAALYLAPSHEFPLVTVTFTFRGGTYLEEPTQAGLAEALGILMRRGGTTTMAPDEFDERLDFLAANVTASVNEEQSRASINCLKSNFDDAFALFMDMIRRPGFEAGRLRIHQDEVIEDLRQRNDAPMAVAYLNLSELVYGADHYRGRQPTLASIEGITPGTLRDLHGRIFHPGNLIIAATGDFEPRDMKETLAAALDGWEPVAGAGAAALPPAPTAEVPAGLFHADVAQADLPQGTTIIVTRGLTRDDPDAIPMTIMNDILGGSGFTSRVTNRVRNEEGLAYSASTFMQPQVYYPGIFGAFYQSKNRTVALAAQIIFEEIDLIRTEPVSPEELSTAKNARILRFPQRFSSKRATLRVFVDDEMTGRDPLFWQTYRERVGSVTAEEVTRVARQYLHPERMLMLVVGNWDEIYGGDLEGRASMNEFFDGNVSHLPMRDPLTLEPR